MKCWKTYRDHGFVIFSWKLPFVLYLPFCWNLFYTHHLWAFLKFSSSFAEVTSPVTSSLFTFHVQLSGTKELLYMCSSSQGQINTLCSCENIVSLSFEISKTFQIFYSMQIKIYFTYMYFLIHVCYTDQYYHVCHAILPLVVMFVKYPLWYWWWYCSKWCGTLYCQAQPKIKLNLRLS